MTTLVFVILARLSPLVLIVLTICYVGLLQSLGVIKKNKVIKVALVNLGAGNAEVSDYSMNEYEMRLLKETGSISGTSEMVDVVKKELGSP